MLQICDVYYYLFTLIMLGCFVIRQPAGMVHHFIAQIARILRPLLLVVVIGIPMGQHVYLQTVRISELTITFVTSITSFTVMYAANVDVQRLHTPKFLLAYLAFDKV